MSLGALRRQKRGKAKIVCNQTLVACLRACRTRLSAEVLQQHDGAFFVIELIVQDKFSIC